jgi:SAM-dependent methyltransferase
MELDRGYGRHFRLVLETVNRLPKDRIYRLLDVGAANRMLRKWLPENVEYESMDYKNYDHETDEKQDYIVNLDDVGNGLKIKIDDGRYDIVVCLETLEHLIYPNKVIMELLRLGKEKGIFFFSLPNEYNFWSRLQVLFGIVPSSREPFLVTEEHRHIHVPTVKLSKKFFEIFLNVDREDFVWQSRTANIYNMAWIDSLLQIFAKSFPSLFSRVYVVRGRKKV